MSKSRRSFTAEQKLEIIEYAEKHGNRAAERFFQVREKNIRDWRKIKPVISVMPSTKKSLRYSQSKLERSIMSGNDSGDPDLLSGPSSSSNYYQHSSGGTNSSTTTSQSHQQNHLKSYDSSIELLFQLKQQVDLLYKRLNYQNIFLKNSAKLHQYWKKNGNSIQLTQSMNGPNHQHNHLVHQNQHNSNDSSMSGMLGGIGGGEGGGGGLGSIDMGLGSMDPFQQKEHNTCSEEEFRTLHDRTGRSYRYWRKRSKQLRKQSPNSESLYETIFDLYERLTIDYKSSLYDLLEGVCITENDIEVNLTDDGGAGNSNDNPNGPSLICPMESCQEKFTLKDKFLDHLMEHRNRGDSLIEKICAQQQQQPAKRPKRMAATIAAAAVKKKAAAEIKAKKKHQTTKKVAPLKLKKIVPKRQASQKRVFHSDDEDDEEEEEDDDDDYVIRTTPQPKTHAKRTPAEPKPPKPTVNLECQIEGCNYVANCSAYLRRHHQWVHLKLRPHKCKECDKDFKTVYALKSHMNVHERKRYPCTEEGCSNHYSSSTAVVKHIKIFHKKISPILKCNWPDCNYSTPYQTSLSLHNNVHSGERPFKCIWPDCGKSFKAGSTLRDHLFVHKDERQFKCTWPGCGYSCNASNNLRKHESIHQRKKLKNQENFQPQQQQPQSLQQPQLQQNQQPPQQQQPQPTPALN